MILYVSEYMDYDDEWKRSEYAVEQAVSCTVSASDNDFSLSLELSGGYNYNYRIGGILRVDVGGEPYEFRIDRISYNSANGSTSISAKYRGYDLNGIYPLPVRGDMMMRTPRDAMQTAFNWQKYGGYNITSWTQQPQDREEDILVNSVITCTEDGFLFPFYLSQQKSLADIAYNDIAGAIGYICRPCNVKDFEIIPPPQTVAKEFKQGVNIADITVERSYTDKTAGVVATYKNTNNAQFSSGQTWELTPGRATLYDAAQECDPAVVMAGTNLFDQAQSYMSVKNPYSKMIDITYNLVPTPDVQGLKIGDMVNIFADDANVDCSQSSVIDEKYDVRIKTFTYDVIEHCYTSVMIGDKKSDYIDLVVSQSEESDRLDSVIYKNIVPHWSADGTYSFTQGSASLIKFADIVSISNGDYEFYNHLYTVRVVGFTGDATKTITLKIDPIPEEDIVVAVKMWKRG